MPGEPVRMPEAQAATPPRGETGDRCTVAGVDVGSECVKAVVLTEDKRIVGRSVLPTSGFFHDRAREALAAALDEAGVALFELDEVCATGFGAVCVTGATRTAVEPTCHVKGAFHHHPQAMTVIDIGGREPRVITCNGGGRRTESRSVRRCALGIGTFLMFAARHLGVHPTRLEELAASAAEPALIGSCCSVFGGSDILERLREGVGRPEIALGCMHSIAERIVEIGGFEEPLVVTGGVPEYFPGVLKALAARTGMQVQAVPEPITSAALGAALLAWEAAHADA
jgi:(R)-2-hydroxyacyl-CoA dehydratese activating ATPase